MKQRVIWLIKAYLILVGICILQKPVFMLANLNLFSSASVADWFKVMWHGLPLDFSVSAYLMVIPSLLMIVSAWIKMSPLMKILRVYFGLVAVMLSMIFVFDSVLYPYWGFKLDSTPFFYFFSSPGDAAASVTLWHLVGIVLALGVVAAVIYGIFRALLLNRRFVRAVKLPVNPIGVTAVLLVMAALLFIPIRGGFTVSTMNVGKVFFSEELVLNHAAINPAFSLLESLSRSSDFGSQYRFMTEVEKQSEILKFETACITPCDTLSTDSVFADNRLFSVERPNVILLILESFSSHLMSTLGGEADVAVNLDSLSKEGVLFTDFYANSFRTDRGLVSILSGYPAQPTTSIMKYPRKSQSLPGLAAALKEEGYHPRYYYGGDADFTNMRSYLVATGFNDIVSDVDFPISQRLSKWGVHDHLVFDRLVDDLAADSRPEEPFFTVLQTSSSHEPFEVPYHRLDNERLNAFAYTDSCIGDFVNRFKNLPQWHRTVVVMIPDHQGCYPESLDNYTPERYRIPLLMVGGAVARPRTVATIGSQQDFAATLLAQLGFDHSRFTFSKDLLDCSVPHYAFFTVPDAFGVITPRDQLIYDCQADAVVYDQGPSPGENLRFGKAYLQNLYDDLSKR